MQLSGKAAAMGQGVIQDVSAALVDTFAQNLAEMLSAERPAEGAAAEAAPGQAAPPPPAPERSPRRGDRRERGQGKAAGPAHARASGGARVRVLAGGAQAVKDVLATVDRWLERGSRIALATVIDTKKSAPQPVGAKMAVNADGEVAGAVSGGCVEGAVIEVAEGVLGGEQPSLLHFGIADEDAWSVGLPCGGEISVWVERYATDGAQARFAELARDGGRGALVTVLGGPAPPARSSWWRPAGTAPARWASPASTRRRALAEAALWSKSGGRHEHGEVELFVDVVAPPPRLLIFGAVDFAAQLAALARAGGWRPFVIDPRSRFATCERFPAAEDVIAAWPREALEQLEGIDRATFIAVLTHDPKLDDAILEIALRSTPPTWARWAAAGRRPSGASGCWPPGSPTRSCRAWRPRSAWTSARSPPRRPPCRSWPR